MEIAVDKSKFRKIALVLENYERGRIGESEASSKIIDWIYVPTRTPKQVLFMVSELFMSVYEGKAHPSKLTRSLLILSTLEGISQRPGLVLDDAWVYVLIWLVKHSEDFEFDNAESRELQCLILICFLWANLWDWIIDVVCSAELCPFPYLRLELFRLGHIFNQNGDDYWLDRGAASRIMEGLVNLFSSIENCDQLFAAAEDKLLCAPAHILPLLNWSEIRDHLINEIVTDVNCLIWPTNDFKLCGRHIRFFVNLLKFISISADISKIKYKSDGNKLRKSLNQCLLFFIFGIRNLTDFNTSTMSVFHAVYRHPMVLPSAKNALASISEASLIVSGLINSRPDELSVVSENNRNEIDEEFNQLKCRRRILLNKLLMRHDYIICVLGLHATTKCFTHNLVKREIHGCKAGFTEHFKNNYKACQQLMFSSGKLMLSSRDVYSTLDFEVEDEDERYSNEIMDQGSYENEVVNEDLEHGMDDLEIEEEDEDSYNEEDNIELGREDADTIEEEFEN